ncbi:lipocalin-like domain-containing protein [Mucilaginibacter sp. ZT4R22]|uniref:Lipocalin-like domain-containing protein n=1 Tax=Mucilaginibacter pankratovii TaxID=2772110 RepID=A0ABR7WP42_9SPHI|nr:lipocalin-like domain-containing protein [Mucilaginibacter pankratovii]MBD1364091.1 lipocalin-like domain-containing protein [Mucilaginibacter pankratovii]
MKATLILAFLLSSCTAFAQKKETKGVNINLTGTYRLKIVDNILADSSRVHLYGDNPKGILMFDAAGNYAMEIYSSDGRPAFAANDKGKGTDEEYRAAVRGSNAHFGKYSIDKATQSIVYDIIAATYPNWENTQRKSRFKFDGKILSYIVAVPTTGNAVRGEVVWERM